MSSNPLAQYQLAIKLARMFNPRIDKLIGELREAIATAQAERGANVIRQFKKDYPEASAFLTDLLAGTPAELAEHLQSFFNIEVGPTGLQVIAQIQERLQYEFRKPRFSRNEQRKLKG
jgi:hypothetical protein